MAFDGYMQRVARAKLAGTGGWANLCLLLTVGLSILLVFVMGFIFCWAVPLGSYSPYFSFAELYPFAMATGFGVHMLFVQGITLDPKEVNVKLWDYLTIIFSALAVLSSIFFISEYTNGTDASLGTISYSSATVPRRAQERLFPLEWPGGVMVISQLKQTVLLNSTVDDSSRTYYDGLWGVALTSLFFSGFLLLGSLWGYYSKDPADGGSGWRDLCRLCGLCYSRDRPGDLPFRKERDVATFISLVGLLVLIFNWVLAFLGWHGTHGQVPINLYSNAHVLSSFAFALGLQMEIRRTTYALKNYDKLVSLQNEIDEESPGINGNLSYFWIFSYVFILAAELVSVVVVITNVLFLGGVQLNGVDYPIPYLDGPSTERTATFVDLFNNDITFSSYRTGIRHRYIPITSEVQLNHAAGAFSEMTFFQQLVDLLVLIFMSLLTLVYTWVLMAYACKFKFKTRKGGVVDWITHGQEEKYRQAVIERKQELDDRAARMGLSGTQDEVRRQAEDRI